MNEPKILSMGRREAVFAALILICSVILWNTLFYAGLNLAFALGAGGIFGASWWYLRGRRGPGHLRANALLCGIILLGFPRSDDTALKLCLLPVLGLVPGMLLCQAAGKHRRSPDSALSLLDSPRALFSFGLGRLGESARGIGAACTNGSPMSRKGLSILLGLAIAIPVLGVLIPLLMFADAAFEGLMDLLPEFDLTEVLVTAMFGVPMAWVLYTRGAALARREPEEKPAKNRRGLNALTVNTVLVLVAALYLVYLFSQLAYLIGGFAGILPEGYTLAQYARRGFFEMGWLCALNLSIIALAVYLVSARGPAPLSTKLLCLFVGLVTEFLVATASGKIFLYIGSYGLTRLRVLTEGFLLWLGVTVAFVQVWLFRPKVSYMKPALTVGLALCAGLLWADVDTVVAAYNVRAYQSGKLETVDVSHLGSLSRSAVPYLAELTGDGDPEVAQMARDVLTRIARRTEALGLRSWNLPAARADQILAPYVTEPIAAIEEAEVTDSHLIELTCILEGEAYTLVIQHDGFYNVLEAGGDAAFLSRMDVQLSNDARTMAEQVTQWVEAQGGAVEAVYYN